MSDTVEDETARNLAAIEAVLQSGRPLLNVEIDLPFTLMQGEQGEVILDCPCLPVGGSGRAGVMRLRLTRAAAEKLRLALDMLEKNPGVQISVTASPGVH